MHTQFLHVCLLGNYDLLGDLLSQLSWLISTAKSGNAISMLADYRLYKSKIPEQVSVEYVYMYMYILYYATKRIHMPA